MIDHSKTNQGRSLGLAQSINKKVICPSIGIVLVYDDFSIKTMSIEVIRDLSIKTFIKLRH